MALDSYAKRANAGWVGIPLPATVIAASLTTEAERATIANSYGGNSLTPPEPGDSSNLLLLYVG